MGEMSIIESNDERQPAFDAADWLRRFKAVGGTAWWDSSVPESIQIGWALYGFTNQQQERAREIFKEIEANDGARSAVRELVIARSEWDFLLARYDLAEATPGLADDDISLAGELCETLMRTPAPDTQALRWKLDYLLDGEEEDLQRSTPSFSREFVQQTIADIHRLLGAA